MLFCRNVHGLSQNNILYVFVLLEILRVKNVSFLFFWGIFSKKLLVWNRYWISKDFTVLSRKKKNGIFCVEKYWLIKCWGGSYPTQQQLMLVKISYWLSLSFIFSLKLKKDVKNWKKCTNRFNIILKCDAKQKRFVARRGVVKTKNTRHLEMWKNGAALLLKIDNPYKIKGPISSIFLYCMVVLSFFSFTMKRPH